MFGLFKKRAEPTFGPPSITGSGPLTDYDIANVNAHRRRWSGYRESIRGMSSDRDWDMAGGRGVPAKSAGYGSSPIAYYSEPIGPPHRPTIPQLSTGAIPGSVTSQIPRPSMPAAANRAPSPGVGSPRTAPFGMPEGSWSNRNANRFGKLPGAFGQLDNRFFGGSSFKRSTANAFGSADRLMQRKIGNTGIGLGRAAVGAGLGLFALQQGTSFVDRMRTGDYTGAALNGGLAIGAGIASYNALFVKNALGKNLRSAVTRGLGFVK